MAIIFRAGQCQDSVLRGEPCIPVLLVLVGARASARFGVWIGKTLEFPDRRGVLKLKRRKRRAPLPTASGCTEKTKANRK